MTADPCDMLPIDLDTDSRYVPDGLANPRWQPDAQLVPAIIGTPRWPQRITDYDESDRCWIVAGLTLAGWSAHEIVHRVGGSIRLIRDIRSRPMTELCRLMQEETTRLGDMLRVEQIAHAATQHQLRQANRAADRYREQRDQVVDAHKAGQLKLFGCGCPRVKYNTYRHQGREYCRACRTERETVRRNRLRPANQPCGQTGTMILRTG